MGLLLLDSFDDRYFAAGSSYASYHTKWDEISEDAAGGYLLEQVTGRTGKACKLGGNSYLKKIGLTDEFNAFLWGFAIKVTAAPLVDTTIIQVEILNQTNPSVTTYTIYKLRTDLKIEIFQDNGTGTVSSMVTTTSALVANGDFVYLESLINANSASLTFLKDGVSWLTSNPVIPVQYNEPIFQSIKISGGIIIDDVYLKSTSTNDYYGSIKIDALVPTSNGTADTNAWQSISYLDVDECYQTNHDGDTTVDDSNTASPSRVSYNFNDQSDKTIKGLQTVSWVRRLNVSPPEANVSMTAITRVSSTYYESNTVSANGTYKILLGIWENNPNTSTSWTTATFNSAEFGVKASPSSINIGRLTAITLELAYIPTEPAVGSRVFIIS